MEPWLTGNGTTVRGPVCLNEVLQILFIFIFSAVIASSSRSMDLSNPSTVCAAPLAPAAIAVPGLMVVAAAQLTPEKRRSPGQQGQGRWRQLIWLLLLGSLTEAGFGQVSLAQSHNPAEPAIIQVQEQVREQVIDPAEPGSNPVTLPEVIVIPTSPTLTNPEAEAQNAAAESSEKARELNPVVPEAEAGESLTPPTLPETPSDSRPAPNPATEATSENASELTDTDRVYLANEQISFVPPIGFTPMSSAEIETKFPGAMPPQYAYGNATRDVSVGVSVSDIPLTPAQLPEVKAFLEEFLENAVPGFQWLEHDFVNLGGQDWIKLEFLSDVSDQRIHNDMYITSLQGKLLGFNFNANIAVDATLRPLLQDSRNSIVVDTAVAAESI